MAFDLESGAQPEGVRLTVRGEVDLDSSPKLLDAIHAALRTVGKGRQLTVVLRDVSYIDSSGVATLIQGLKQAGRRDVRFALEEPSARVDSVLGLAHLHGLFDIRRPEPGV